MTKRFTNTELNEINHFNNLADKYDTNYAYNTSFTKYKIKKKTQEFRKFVTKYKNNKHLKILDLGCGTGEYTIEIAKLFPDSKIYGLDISPSILKVAKGKSLNNKNIIFKNASAFNTGFKDGYFDVVCGFYFLHHVELSKINTELKRILNSTGVAFFCEPNILNPVVYLIKSNKYLKKLVNDSPDEWAINPFKIKNQFNKFSTEYVTSEFVIPFGSVPIKIMKIIDNITANFSNMPLIKYFGGSVFIKLLPKQKSS